MAASTQTLRPFAVPVHVHALAAFTEIRPALLDAVAGLRRAGPGLDASNRNGWHSSRDLLRRAEAPWPELLRRLNDACATVVGDCVPTGMRHVITECWAMVLEPSGWAVPHHHHPAAWTGVLYLDTEHGAPADAEPRAGQLELLNPIPAAELHGQPSGAVVPPRDGLVVVFPGSVLHFVHPVRAARPRISLSFNVGLAVAE